MTDGAYQFGLDQVMANHRGVVDFFGRVTFGASGAVSAKDVPGCTVTKPAGTGIYRFTLTNPYQELLSFDAKIYDATERDANWHITTDYTAANGYFDVTYLAAGSAANANSGDVALVRFAMRARV